MPHFVGVEPAGGGGGGGAVDSVAGKTGAVTLAHGDITDWLEALQDAVGASIAAGTGITVTYDDVVGTITIDCTVSGGGAVDSVAGRTGDVTLTHVDLTDFTEAVQDVIGALVTAGTNCTVTYNDALNTFVIDVADAPVQTVAGRTGDVVIAQADVTGLVTALAAKAPTASPTFTGTVTLPSATALTSPVLNTGVSGTAVDNDTTLSGDSTTKIPTQHAVKGYVDAEVATVSDAVDAIPENVSADPAKLSLNTTGTGASAQTTFDPSGCAPVTITDTIEYVLSDEVTALAASAGTPVLTVRAPYDFDTNGIPKAYLLTASSSGVVTIDVKKNGTTIFSTTLTIDASETTSTTAATAAVLAASPTSFSEHTDVITFFVTGAGTGAKGLKIAFPILRSTE